MIDRFEVEGQIPLVGSINCAGSKNAALPLMAASLLTDGTTVIYNVPDLQDIRTMAMVLRYLGADVVLSDGILRIDSSECKGWEAPYDLVRKMRASFYVMGPLLARYGKAKVSLPGGCALGPRPVDLHLKAFAKMGCDVTISGGYVWCNVSGSKMCGNHISFDISSVGSTGNLLMAAVLADGQTVIDNASFEPEIVDLCEMLVKMGASIEGIGTAHLEITGVGELHPVEWKVIPDRIEAATLLFAGAVTGGEVTVCNCRPDQMSIVLDKLKETGTNLKIDDDTITLKAKGIRLQSVDVSTAAYPGFPTDLQPIWITLMALADGNSLITDSIYPERFTHILELARLGADIRKDGNSATVRGVKELIGASVMCSDIRASAGVVLAALAARGHSDILRVYHIDRGYERIESKLSALGANIRRIRE